MPVDSLAAVDGHFLFKVVKMSNLTRGEKAAYAIIAKLESERDALRKQLDQGDAVGWQIWMGGFGWCNCGKDQYEFAAEAERRQVYAAPHAKPVSNDEYKAIIEVGYKLGYEAAICDIAKPAIPEGFAIVPIEPTIKMLDACLVDGATEAQRKVKNVCADIWAKMLAAAR